ncbi:MAG: hypothetical protein HQK49_05380 [Oligoflexia bacterium]|nr:hypothetical protein [Oligoflexia bacterium]
MKKQCNFLILSDVELMSVAGGLRNSPDCVRERQKESERRERRESVDKCINKFENTRKSVESGPNFKAADKATGGLVGLSFAMASSANEAICHIGGGKW